MQPKSDLLKFFSNYIILLISFLIIIRLFNLYTNKNDNSNNCQVIFVSEKSKIQADSILATLSLEEKIKQLIIYQFSDKDSVDNNLLTNLGGIFYKTDSSHKFIKIKNQLIATSKNHPFIGTQPNITFLKSLKNINTFKNEYSFKAIKDSNLYSKSLQLLFQQYKELGVNICLTLNSNISKDTIKYDSVFVNQNMNKIIEFIKLASENNILSYIQNPQLPNDSLLNNKFNHFYIKLLKSGLSCITMSDTLKFSLRDTKNNQLNYNGLKIAYLKSKEQLAGYFSNGFDMFLSSVPPDSIFKEIIKLIDYNMITEKDLDEKLIKILQAKQWIAKNKKKKETSVQSHSILSLVLPRKIIKNSLITIYNNKNTLPFKKIIRQNYYIFSIGNTNWNDFIENARLYADFKYKKLKTDSNQIDAYTKYLKNYNIIFLIDTILPKNTIIPILDSCSNNNKVVILNFGNNDNCKSLLNFSALVHSFDTSKLAQQYAAQLLFGGIASKGQMPFYLNDSLSYLAGIQNPKTRLEYTIPEEAGIDSKKLLKIDTIANEGIYRGAFPGCQVFVAKKGKVIYHKTYGYHTYSKKRRVKKTDLYDIASVTKIASTTIASMKMLENGKINLDAPLGNYFKDTKIDYTRIKPDTIVHIDTLYLSEIKNIKKFAKETDTIHLNDSIIVAYDTLFIKLTPKNNIFKVTLRELLVHKSGILPALPILPYLLYKKNWLESLNLNDSLHDISAASDSVYKIQKDTIQQDTNIFIFNRKKELKKAFEQFYSNRYLKDSAEVEIAENFYLKNQAFDTLWINTKQLAVYSKKVYEYSDVNMILLQMAIDTINKKPIDDFMKSNFYEPLGMRYTSYKPLKYFSKNKITPTENDKYWRAQIVHGHVHDPSAALLGGISGNAGLFSTANDLGILFQMLLNGGEYGGKKYLSKKTINLFTKHQEDSHRGLGFNKKTKRGIIAHSASNQSYGHTGFTGTCVWVDPENELVYVFISNRVHPNIKNFRINSYKIRQKIHQVVYDSFINNY